MGNKATAQQGGAIFVGVRTVNASIGGNTFAGNTATVSRYTSVTTEVQEEVETEATCFLKTVNEVQIRKWIHTAGCTGGQAHVSRMQTKAAWISKLLQLSDLARNGQRTQPTVGDIQKSRSDGSLTRLTKLTTCRLFSSRPVIPQNSAATRFSPAQPSSEKPGKTISFACYLKQIAAPLSAEVGGDMQFSSRALFSTNPRIFSRSAVAPCTTTGPPRAARSSAQLSPSSAATLSAKTPLRRGALSRAAVHRPAFAARNYS